MKENIKKLSTNDEKVAIKIIIKYKINYENYYNSCIDEINNKL